ncbi:proteoglycan 4-like isoform X3 [Bolinopsis microptera]
MDRWLSCLTSILGESKRRPIVASPTGSPKRSKSMLKKVGIQISKMGPSPGSTLKKFESIAEDSSSSSHLKHSDSSYFSQDDPLRGDDVSAFDEDLEETFVSSKSVSSHMSSVDSAIEMGSERSSKIRLTDSLPKAELPLLDEVSQREWMLRMNQRNSSAEKVSHHVTNSNDMLLPSSNFMMRTQIMSPTLNRDTDPAYNFDVEADEKTPLYDADHDYLFDENNSAEPTYDIPAQDPAISLRQVETVTKTISSPDEDLYDIPSNVIRSLPAQKPKIAPKPKIILYDSLAPAPEAVSTEDAEDIYDVPSLRSTKQPSEPTEVDGIQVADLEPLYDTPPPKREPNLLGSSLELNSRRATGNSVLSNSSETTSNSSYIRTTTMSMGRHDSIDSAYQMLVIDDKESAGQVVKIEEEAIYNIPPPSRDTPPPPRATPPPLRETVPPPHATPLPPRETPPPPQYEEPHYNIPPARTTPPSPLSSVSDPLFRVPVSDPIARSPPKPYLPPRTDRPPVPSRGQTLGRPSRPPVEDPKPARPQSETMCRPNRPVPLLPPETRDSHLTEVLPAEQSGTVTNNTLTRAKMNHRDQFGPSLERKSAPDNEYLEVRATPSPPPPREERPVPPPLLPRTPPTRSTAQPLLTPPRGTISAGILSATTAAVGAPFTPPRIPQRAGTVAGGQHHNPFLEGYTPPKESTMSLSRPSTSPRGGSLYHGPNRGAMTLPPPNRGATLPPKPGILTLSKKAQDEFDAIPDSPTPTEELHRSTSDPIQSSANTTIIKSGNSKYPTIQNNNPGMVKVKPGYQNVTEVKGALQSRGDSVQGERHGKLNRRPVPEPGYTPMGTMEERMKRAAASNEREGYEPMMSHEARMANAQINQQNSRPLPPRTLAVSGRDPEYVDATGAAPSPVYVATSGAAPSPIFVESGRLQAQITADISHQPEFMRLGEIDMTLSDFLPMTSGDDYQDEYLTMESLGSYQGRSQPHDDYLAMAPPPGDYLEMEARPPADDYLAMEPHSDYLAMNSSASVPDKYSNLTFSNS